MNLPNSLQGVALVASPMMADPRFAETVILLLNHGEEGAMGVVLNRPINADQQQLLVKAANLSSDTELNFHFGGPVAGPVIVLQARKSRTGNRPGHLFFVQEKAQLSELLRKVDDCRFFVGHVTWKSGQLEQELEEGLWMTVPVSPELLFGSHEQVWAEAIRDIGRSFYRDVLGITNVPPDPSLN